MPSLGLYLYKQICNSYYGPAPCRPAAGQEGEIMAKAPASEKTRYTMTQAGIAALFEVLRRRGLEVIGPKVRDGAIVLDVLESFEDLASGWVDEQGPAHYRLHPDGESLFQYVVGPQSWKKYLHPPEVRLLKITKADGHLAVEQEDPPARKYAFFGMRACEIAALAALDRVLAGDAYEDLVYKRRRADIFIVAVNCTRAAPTCFCGSMNTGPRAEWGFDICLTELAEDRKFLVETGSERGERKLNQVFQQVEKQEAAPEECDLAGLRLQQVAAGLVRKVDTQGLRDLLYDNLDHPQWEKAGRRCLACGNCTMVCPTCFCTSVEDSSAVDGQSTERWRRQDSCFSQQYSFIHGGSVRQSVKARYRQWVTHKMASWVDQFGTLGCVGCGRCITWCPAGIDITAEVAGISVPAAPAARTG